MVKNIHLKCPKILVTTSTFPRWENDPEPAFVYELSRRLRSCFDVTILSPRSPGCKKQETMAGLRVIRYPYFFKKWENLATHSGGILSRLRANPLNYFMVPFFVLGQVWAMMRLLRRENYDLIHAHWIIPQGVVAVAAMILSGNRIPLVCTSHGADLFALRGKLFQSTKRWVLDHCKAVTVVSRAMLQIVLDMGVESEKVQVIPMGVDLQKFFVPNHQVIRNRKELLFVGRLVEKKGLNVLLEAMPKVLARYPDVRLTVAGSGPLESQLREQCRTLDISENVDFLGMVPQAELPGLYQRAAMSVFPFIEAESGDQEGFGLVMIEAMGCGCPVIASHLPAIHDSVTHGKNGLLVPPGNPGILAKTIIKLISDPDLAEKLGMEAGKRVLKCFDWEVIGRKYADLIVLQPSYLSFCLRLD